MPASQLRWPTRRIAIATGLAVALATASADGLRAQQDEPQVPAFEDVLWQEALRAIALHRLHPSASIPWWVGVDAPPSPPERWSAKVVAATRQALEENDDALTGAALHLLAAEFERTRDRADEPKAATPPADEALPDETAPADEVPARSIPGMLRSQLGSEDPVVVIAALRGILASGVPRLVTLVEDLAANEGLALPADAGDDAVLVDRLGRDLSANAATLSSLARLASVRDGAARAPHADLADLAQGLADLTPDAQPIAVAAVLHWIARLPLDARDAETAPARAALVDALVAIATVEERPRRRLFASQRSRVTASAPRQISPQIRVHALTALATRLGPGASRDHQRAKRAVLATLRDDELAPGLRAAAAMALGSMARPVDIVRGDRTISTALQRVMSRESDPDLRGAAALALGHIGGKRNRTRLLSSVSTDRDIRHWALLALGVCAHGERMLGAPPDRRLHLRLATHRNDVSPEVELAATLAVGLAGLPSRGATAQGSKRLGPKPLGSDPLGRLSAWLGQTPGPGTASPDRLTPDQWEAVHNAIRGSDPLQVRAAGLLAWALDDPSLTERLVEAATFEARKNAETQASEWCLAHLADGRQHELILQLFSNPAYPLRARAVAADLLQRALAPSPFESMSSGDFDAWWHARPDLPAW